MKKLSNVTRKEFEGFLLSRGYSLDRISGGHAVWTKPGVRSIVLQTHKEPIPMFVIKSNLMSMDVSTKDFLWFLNNGE